MVMYILVVSSKLNSAFSKIGKATADKITAKLVGKTHAFAFALLINSNTRSCSEQVCEISNIFCAFRYFCLILNEKFIGIILPDTFLSFGCLHLRVLVHAGFGFLYI